MRDKINYTFAGHSLVFNTLFVIINLIGVVLVTMGFHDANEASKWVYAGTGFGLLAFSLIFILIFKGIIMMSHVSRLIVGSIFIVSGLIKANDPIGFSYKLEEYFEDGALAFRFKEWFAMPDFSLEFFIPYALTLSVVICIVEILLGVLVLIGGKIKLTSWLLLLMIAFFTFLTWHTANCNPDEKFVDRDTYAANSEIAQTKIDEAKTDKDVKIISKKNGQVVVDEIKNTQCVLDCGCFGDAMKGSVGRSMTPKESMWKDIVLFYFIAWIFATQWMIKPNKSKENTIMIPISIGIVLFLSYIFGWYFPVAFALIAILGALWIRQSGGKLLGNYFGSSLFIVALCLILTTYVLMYEPIKDYRPYAVGSNLIEKMHDGIEGKFQNVFKMKDLKTNKEITMTEKEYMDPVKKIWQDPNFKFISMSSEEVVPGKLPSVDSSQFNPTVSLENLSDAERKLPYVAQFIDNNLVDGVLLKDLSSNHEMEVPLSEYDSTAYDTTHYHFVRKIGMLNPEITDISIRNLLTSAPTAIVVFSRNVNEGNWEHVQMLKTIFKRAQKDSIPFVMVTSSLQSDINNFRKKYNFDVPTFIMDFIEIKVVTRSNPSLMILQKGVVKGKFPFRSTPTYDWILNHIIYKSKKK